MNKSEFLLNLADIFEKVSQLEKENFNNKEVQNLFYGWVEEEKKRLRETNNTHTLVWSMLNCMCHHIQNEEFKYSKIWCSYQK